MMFSVLVPVYNTSAYLSECVESILSQTEKDYEIVLINDGSKDKSGAICEEYGRQYPNIRVIHKNNEGLLLTRRRGFQEAQGKYFICVDSDDCLVDSNALKKIREMIEKEHCDLVLYEYICGTKKDEANRKITLFDLPCGYVFNENEKIVLYKELLQGKCLNPLWIKCVSRNIIDFDINYEEVNKTLTRSQGEDLLQSFPILTAAKRIGYLKEPLYFYRWNENSISRNISLDFYYAYKTIYQTADQYIDLWKIENDVIERHKYHRISMIMGVLVNGLRTNEKKKSKKFINSLSKDEFFSDLFDVQNKKNVLLYYKILGFLITHNCQRSTLVLIEVVSNVSSWKKRMKNNA